MTHRFQCRCGTVQGEVAGGARAMRAVCYCGDCQAYAHLLGEPGQVLDALGGTDIVATQSSNVRFTAGTPQLACLSLSPRGLLRWYAACCRTPIANTPRDWKLPYAGLVHTVLERPDPIERSFPPVQMHVNGKSAHGKPPGGWPIGATLQFGGMMLRLLLARLRGSYRVTPFFDAQGAPVVPVQVAPHEAVEAARRQAPR